ncbi:MAG: branched-chain amino acid ABC transporter substrate-binding protein [Desulfobacterales bacterium GWB2_56_26]|nr:MAG: branched-chain amino acid ABC transporter substrate-binding protein [Desulfobacterales bacterium GWB2_56_26]
MKKIIGKSLCTLAAACLMTAAPVWAENIKIGALLAVTGPASFLGGPEARTLEMLVEEANAKGGINGNKIELLVKDTAGNPEKAISLAKQLLEEDKVLAVVGPSSSGETMSVKKIFEDAQTPLLSCAAAEVIVNPLASWVFKTPQNDSSAAIKIFMEMNKLGIEKIAVLVDNSGFGKAGKEQLVKIAPDYKIDIVEAEVYDAKATDLSAVVAKIKANPAVQGIVNWSIVPAQSIVVKNIRQAGWQVPIFQSHGFGNIKYVEAAGAAAEGVIFPASRLLMADQLPDSHPQKALLVKYVKDYETKFQEPASTFGGHAYDAFMILEKAVAVGGNDKAKVREAIEGLHNLPGTAGVFTFSATDHNGLDLNAFEMMTVKDGKFVPYTGK